jgi:hypothetical protein
VVALIRLALILLTRRWGLIVIGVILALAGLITGASSHQVSYTKVTQGKLIHYLTEQSSGDAYMQLAGSPNFYIVHQNDFTPSLSLSVIQNDSDIVDFVYRPDQTTHFDINAQNTGANYTGDAYTVESITFYDTNGQNPQTFTSPEFRQNPNGFYDNNWAAGIGLLLAGLVVFGLSFFWPQIVARRLRAAGKVAPAAAIPPQYPQPYQGPAQYPANPQNPAQPPYTQPGAGQYAPYPGQQSPAYPAYPGQQPPAYPTPGQQPQYPPQPGQYPPTQLANPNDMPPYR